MFPLIFVQFLKDSMLVALMDMVLVSSPVPSPLHTAEKKYKKTAAYIVEPTFPFVCKVKLLSISHLFMYFIHFSRRFRTTSRQWPSGNTPRSDATGPTHVHIWTRILQSVQCARTWTLEKAPHRLRENTQDRNSTLKVTEPGTRGRAFSLWGKPAHRE